MKLYFIAEEDGFLEKVQRFVKDLRNFVRTSHDSDENEGEEMLQIEEEAEELQKYIGKHNTTNQWRSKHVGLRGLNSTFL